MDKSILSKALNWKKNNQPFINYFFIFPKDLNKINHKFNWKEISDNENLTTEFIIEFHKFLNWKIIYNNLFFFKKIQFY